MESDLLRAADVQRMLACSKSHLSRLAEAHVLIPIDISLTGRPCLRWRPEDVERLIKEREIRG